MDRLSSCYFCGDALDASLSEYPVVPRDVEPDAEDQRTVVLCSSCRQKLANVVETVVDAVDEDRPPAEPSDDQSDVTDPEEWDFGRGGQPGEAVESESSADSGAGDGPGEQSRTTEAAPSESRRKTRSESTGAGASRQSATDDDASADPLSTAEGRSRSSTDERSQSASDTDDSGDDERTYSSGRSAADVGEAADRGEAATGETEAAAADDQSDDGPSMTALEYNRVMRLLQNREFPVDRDSFAAVALNAYDIDREEFDRIVEAAVDRGLIDVEDGQFVAAE